MGWKCACLFVGEIENGYFGTSPQHSPEKARSILQTLGYDPGMEGTKDGANFYQRGAIIIGAFEKGACVSTFRIMEDLEKAESSFFKLAMSCYPDSSLLALGLQSVTDFAAFSYYKNGQLIRTFACAEGDIIHESGNRLPEEDKAYVDSFERDGERVFPRKIGEQVEEFGICGIADEIIFALGTRPLGISLDTFDDDSFETESFQLKDSTNSKSKSDQNSESKPFWKFW